MILYKDNILDIKEHLPVRKQLQIQMPKQNRLQGRDTKQGSPIKCFKETELMAQIPYPT